MNSELYDFGVTAILANILPACDVIYRFITFAYQTNKMNERMKRGKEKLYNYLFHSLTSSFFPNRLINKFLFSYSINNLLE